ncbi:nucleotidyltransferase family protein [Jiella marina]|uniref:nucleotidyltransferase family protein n=1 Tax=Jiella sp. LLJ827 TaxID=2917712 RepID=UPI0021019593|nr:nucleotidyltransferase domain-containing protein [Jiella sp. LLJ827]MCQ0989081.1 nucleotidyltransferase domain-containing protein [Jiella sp. LLJ827]
MEAERRKDAARKLIEQLRRYALEHSGRFHVFGSAATGMVRHDSDFDVLVDFPPEAEHDAFTFVEELCGTLRLPLDALSSRTMSERFMRRNRATMTTLGEERPVA